MNYKIRLATPADSANLSRLKQKIWNSTYRGIYDDKRLDNYNYKEHTTKFDNLIKNNDIYLYVVESNNNIVGYMAYGKLDKPFQNIFMEIKLLYISKEFQGLGLGTKLFNLAYSSMKASGVKKFLISCNKYNLSAQKFYESLGGVKIYSCDDNNKKDKYKVQVKYLYNIYDKDLNNKN